VSCPKSTPRVPFFRRHKPSGQAVVTLNGRDVYGTKASRAEYDRLIGEWLAGGRCLLDGDHRAELTVAEVVLPFWRFARAYYRKDGRPTLEVAEYRLVLRMLRQRYGFTRAVDFGPLALSRFAKP